MADTGLNSGTGLRCPWDALLQSLPCFSHKHNIGAWFIECIFCIQASHHVCIAIASYTSVQQLISPVAIKLAQILS